MPELTMDDVTAAAERMVKGVSTPEQEAVQHSLPELAHALRMTRGHLQALIESWSQEQLQTRPPQGATSATGEDLWSATEAITHMVVTQNWYMMHMSRLLGQRKMFDTMPRGLGDQADNTMPKNNLSAAFKTATETLLADIEAIPADADLAAQRDSTFFGHLSLRGWVSLAIIHDILHLTQIQRLPGYPNFPAS